MLSVVHATTPVAPMLSKQTLVAAAQESATDNISSGWCGRGMLSVLQSVGLGKGLHGSNGQDWETNLMQAGWKPVRVATPQQAPLGSVLVYLSDTREGKRPRGTPGGYYGHVEMVALNSAGQRLYVSDSPRALPGGSVRDNFTGRAWLPPGSRSIWKAPPMEDQIAEILEARKRMALDKFDGKKGEYSALATALPLR